MRIGLSLLYAHPRIGGAWTYITNVLKALSQAGSNYSYIAYVDEASTDVVPNCSAFRKRYISTAGGRRFARVAAEHVIVPRLAAEDGLDVLHWFGNVAPLRNTVPAVVTIYDLKMFEEGYRRGFDLRTAYMRMLIPRTVRSAAHLLPMSGTTAGALTRFFSVDECAMTVIPPPLDVRFRRVSDRSVRELLQKYSLPENFWLYVAHYYPHKNHARLLAAYAEYRRRNSAASPLVLCGRKNEGYSGICKLISEYGLERSVSWRSELLSEEMPVLYSAARALVFPSEYEGAGLPILEAMACGCAVTASKIPAVTEFASDAALTFDPVCVRSIAEALERMERDEELRSSLAVRGLARAQMFTGNGMAKKLVHVYKAAAAGRSTAAGRIG